MSKIRKIISICILISVVIILIVGVVSQVFDLNETIPRFVSLLVFLTAIPSIILKIIFDYIIVDKDIVKTSFFEKCIEALYSSSAWVGFFERIIIYAALVSSPSVGEAGKLIAIVVTIKGFMRYPEIRNSANNTDENKNTGKENQNKSNEKINAEKFLIGTMFSIIWVILIFKIGG